MSLRQQSYSMVLERQLLPFSHQSQSIVLEQQEWSFRQQSRPIVLYHDLPVMTMFDPKDGYAL